MDIERKKTGRGECIVTGIVGTKKRRVRKLSKSSHMPKVLVLGTFHMGPTTDMFRAELDNLLSAKRQQEIQEVVARLKEFNPTKVAVEIEKKKNGAINEKYRHYLEGNYELEVNEVYQLGFRVAADLHHEELYCIDWMEQGASKRSAGEVYEWAKANQPELFNTIYGWLNQNNPAKLADSYKSILEMYRNCNEQVAVKQHHYTNINMARIKSGEEYVGMDWLIWWYQRNLIMFSNLADLATSSDERILLIVGGAMLKYFQISWKKADYSIWS